MEKKHRKATSSRVDRACTAVLARGREMRGALQPASPSSPSGEATIFPQTNPNFAFPCSFRILPTHGLFARSLAVAIPTRHDIQTLLLFKRDSENYIYPFI